MINANNNDGNSMNINGNNIINDGFEFEKSLSLKLRNHDSVESISAKKAVRMSIFTIDEEDYGSEDHEW